MKNEDHYDVRGKITNLMNSRYEVSMVCVRIVRKLGRKFNMDYNRAI
jgi:hypothetical protein